MDHDAEYDRLVALVEAGLATVEGETITLTPEGEKVARQLAMTGDPYALLAGLLGE
jgi:hypothetical protein